MRREDPQPWERSCPVLHRPRAHEFWRGFGWLFLLASLVIHAALLMLLPNPLHSPLIPRQDILLQLKEPTPPPPVREPLPEPPRTQQSAPPRPAERPEPNPEPREQPALDPSPVISKSKDESNAVLSGPAFPAPPQEDPDPQVESVPKPPPEPPPAPPPDQVPEEVVDVQALLLSYASGVKAQVLAHKRYPIVAQRLGHSGDVQVGFTIDQNGELTRARIKASSGWSELDDAALEAVSLAAPFEAIPPETGREELSLSITLKFILE